MRYIIQNVDSDYKNIIDKIINDNKNKIFDFFNHSVIELPFNIYIYDSIESLVLGLRSRGFSKYPDYMCACHKDEDNSLNFFEPKDNPSDDEWSKREYENVVFHELVHGIQFTLFGSTPEWLNEGIAKYLDGTYSKGIKWLLENYINKNAIPKQKELEEEFGIHEYDSYDYAYLMVCYLIDNYGKNYLIELLCDKNKLDLASRNLLDNSIKYYNDKFFAKGSDYDERKQN